MQAVIVIPVYRPRLTELEQIALTQLNRVLGKYTKVFVAPESMKLDYGVLADGYKVERFSDKFFSGTEMYSHLLLSEAFYERFAEYDYMLIYQTDAFVFSDRLAEFCALGCDYIGAPVNRWDTRWHTMGTSVGNGGFSLHRIEAALRMLREKHLENPMKDLFLRFEDLFWGFCGSQPDIDFHVPSQQIAAEFAVQDNVAHAYQKMIKKHDLPFGCHGWYKYNVWFWQEVIRSCGYPVQIEVRPADRYFLAVRRSMGKAFQLQRQRGEDFRLLWHDLQQGTLQLALERLMYFMGRRKSAEQWAQTQSRMEEIVCLWRICALRLQRDVRNEEQRFVLEMIEQTLLEILRRMLAAGRIIPYCLTVIVEAMPQIVRFSHTEAADRLRIRCSQLLCDLADVFMQKGDVKKAAYCIRSLRKVNGKEAGQEPVTL